MDRGKRVRNACWIVWGEWSQNRALSLGNSCLQDLESVKEIARATRRAARDRRVAFSFVVKRHRTSENRLSHRAWLTCPDTFINTFAAAQISESDSRTPRFSAPRLNIKLHLHNPRASCERWTEGPTRRYTTIVNEYMNGLGDAEQSSHSAETPFASQKNKPISFVLIRK